MRRRSAWPTLPSNTLTSATHALMYAQANALIQPPRLRTAGSGADPPCLRTLRRRCRCPQPRSSRVATGCRGPSACSRPRPATCTRPTGAVASPCLAADGSQSLIGGSLPDGAAAASQRHRAASATALSCSRTWATRRAAYSVCVATARVTPVVDRRRRHAPAADQLRADRRAAAAVDHRQHAARAARARLPPRRRRWLRRARRRARARASSPTGSATPTKWRSTLTARCLYVNETFARRTSRFAIRAGGALGPRETFTEYGEGTYPDGLAFDDEGYLWVVSHRQQSRASRRARRTVDDRGSRTPTPRTSRGCEAAYRAGTLGRPHLDRAASERLRNISSIAFGGADRRTAYPGLPARRFAVRPFARPSPGVAPAHWHWPQS